MFRFVRRVFEFPAFLETYRDVMRRIMENQHSTKHEQSQFTEIKLRKIEIVNPLVFDFSLPQTELTLAEHSLRLDRMTLKPRSGHSSEPGHAADLESRDSRVWT